MATKANTYLDKLFKSQGEELVLILGEFLMELDNSITAIEIEIVKPLSGKGSPLELLEIGHTKVRLLLTIGQRWNEKTAMVQETTISSYNLGRPNQLVDFLLNEYPRLLNFTKNTGRDISVERKAMRETLDIGERSSELEAVMTVLYSGVTIFKEKKKDVSKTN